MNPTTQAVEQLREKVKLAVRDWFGEPVMSVEDWVMNALADTLKIFDTSGDYIKLCRSIGTKTSQTDVAFNRGVTAALDLQRQRLELVVEEMKCR